MKWKNTARWEPIKVPSGKLPWAERLKGIIADLDVEHAFRYSPGKDTTWCNVYVTDVIQNMGVSAPRHWMKSDGRPSSVGRGIEMRANSLIRWFREHGPRWGWIGSDEGTAAAAAERGHLVVVGYLSPPQAGPGHVAIVLGRRDGEVLVSQAGRINRAEAGLRQCFGELPVEFWIQSNREWAP